MTDMIPPALRPPPAITEDNLFFWEAARDGRLVAQRCGSCGLLRHPPRTACPACQSLDTEIAELTGEGEIYSYSLLWHPRSPRFDYPVIAVLVDLAEGIRVVSNLVGAEPGDVRIGLPVTVEFEPCEGDLALPVFRPRQDPPASQRARPCPRTEEGGSEERATERRGRGQGPQAPGGERGNTAIVGAGSTEFSKEAGRSETRLATEAILAALADAGLSVADVDGLVSYTIDPVEETELVRGLGIPEIRWSSRVPYGGGGSQGVLLHAAAAVASGAADTVVAYRAVKARSGNRFGAARAGIGPSSSHSGTTAGQWAAPYGVLTPASWFSLNAARYMHRFGVTNEDFGRAVVQLRAYAATNPAARFYGRPITLADHQASRWIAEPAIRLFDCCQETDGSVAFVITSSERAAETRAPVTIAAAGGAALLGQEIATDHYSPDLSVMDGSAALARLLFDRSDIKRSDIDVALIYDAFSPILFMQLEGLGFCGPGEAKDFVADGNLAPGGALPCNTNGGLIGEGYIHGLNLTLEAVRQLRGTAANQLAEVRTALVSASRTGVILTR